jgi:recombination protein RecA
MLYGFRSKSNVSPFLCTLIVPQVDQLVRSSAVDVIVVDSVAALVPRAELEGDMSDQNIGLQARLMSKALRKITGSLALSQCTVIFLNQLRSKVGVIYGSPEVTSGGNALKFYASIRLDTRRKEILPDNSGIRVKVKVVKNKVAAPFQTVILDILFGTGVDYIGGMLDAAVDLDVVTRKGSWYAYRDENLAQGRQRCVELLRNDEELAADLEADVRRVLAEIQEGRLPESLRKPRQTSSLPTSPELDLPEPVGEDSYLE